MKKKTKIDLVKLDSDQGNEGPSSPRPEGKPPSEDSGAEGLKKRGMKKPLLIYGMAGFILLGGAVGAGGYLGYIPIPGLSQSKISAPPKPASKEMGPVLKLSPLVVNLKEESGRSYLRTTIVLELESDKVGEEIKSRMSLLTDRAISTLSDKMLDNMKQPASKEQLKQELLSNLNQLFASPRIKGIYFDEFLYQ